jgi:hypothetical protein
MTPGPWPGHVHTCQQAAAESAECTRRRRGRLQRERSAERAERLTSEALRIRYGRVVGRSSVESQRQRSEPHQAMHGTYDGTTQPARQDATEDSCDCECSGKWHADKWKREIEHLRLPALQSLAGRAPTPPAVVAWVDNWHCTSHEATGKVGFSGRSARGRYVHKATIPEGLGALHSMSKLDGAQLPAEGGAYDATRQCSGSAASHRARPPRRVHPSRRPSLRASTAMSPPYQRQRCKRPRESVPQPAASARRTWRARGPCAPRARRG